MQTPSSATAVAPSTVDSKTSVDRPPASRPYPHIVSGIITPKHAVLVENKDCNDDMTEKTSQDKTKGQPIVSESEHSPVSKDEIFSTDAKFPGGRYYRVDNVDKDRWEKNFSHFFHSVCSDLALIIVVTDYLYCE